jgi:hypothetical protein
MALRLIEGFDDGLAVVRGWNPTHWTNQAPDIRSGGRFGGSALYTDYIKGGVKVISPAITTTGILGFAHKPSAIVAFNWTIVQFGFARLVLVDGGRLQIARADNGAQIAITVDPVWTTAGIWRYIELKYTPVSGACELRVDGTVVASGTLPTQANIWEARFPDLPANTPALWIDDVYVVDTSGTTNNDYLGDVRVDLLLPTGDGAHTGMTPSTGTAHYALVDESIPNTTDYVSSSVAGTKDTYQFQDMSTNTAAIFGLSVANYARKDAAGAGSLANIVRVGGTDYAQPAIPLSVSWTANENLVSLNPATNAPWTVSAVNGVEFGVEVN